MTSEWMRVMLDEIARKQEEGRAARLELERRAREGATVAAAQGANGRAAEPAAPQRPAAPAVDGG